MTSLAFLFPALPGGLPRRVGRLYLAPPHGAQGVLHLDHVRLLGADHALHRPLQEAELVPGGLIGGQLGGGGPLGPQCLYRKRKWGMGEKAIIIAALLSLTRVPHEGHSIFLSPVKRDAFSSLQKSV